MQRRNMQGRCIPWRIEPQPPHHEHHEDYKNRTEGSHMWKHCMQKHNGEGREFSMRIDRTFRKDPLLRQITEAIAIQDTDEEHRMNSKSEWHLPKVPRVTIGTD